MRNLGIQILISTPPGSLIFGITPFYWQFKYCRMVKPMHAVILILGPFSFIVTDDLSCIHNIIEMEDV